MPTSQHIAEVANFANEARPAGTGPAAGAPGGPGPPEAAGSGTYRGRLYGVLYSVWEKAKLAQFTAKAKLAEGAEICTHQTYALRSSLHVLSGVRLTTDRERRNTPPTSSSDQRRREEPTSPLVRSSRWPANVRC